MAVMAPIRQQELSTTLSHDDLLNLIGEEAGMLGLSAQEAVARVKAGTQSHGYIWDDISLLTSLLSE